MKSEIRAVSGYRALIISRNYISLLLGIVSLYLGFIKYAVSSLYILLLLLALPPILRFALLDYSKKNPSRFIAGITKDIPFKLNFLKEKYKYTRLNYISNSISYLFALVLICLWQLNYRSRTDIATFLIYVPEFILVSGLLLRLLGAAFYRLKFPYDLSHNRL
jgi:hypothetical protein